MGYAEARRAIGSPRYAELVARMQGWLSEKGWHQGSNGRKKSLDGSAAKLAARLLAKRHKAVLKLGRDFEQLSPQERHRLRIALKKLRYTAEFFRSLYQNKREQFIFTCSLSCRTASVT